MMDLFDKINVVSCLDNISGASTSIFGLGGGRRRGANEHSSTTVYMY